MMIVSGIWGPEVWQTPLIKPFPFLAGFLDHSTSVRDLWVPIVFGTFLVAHVPACVYNVYKARSARGLRTLPLLLEWTPLIVFVASCAAWLNSPHSVLLSENHLTLFCVTLSMVFGRMTTKIILAHLTRQPFPWWTVLLTPLVGGAVMANLPALGFPKIFNSMTEVQYLWSYFVIAVLVYGRWAYLVITSICDYLGINELTMPREKWQSAESPSSNGSVPKKD